MRKENSTNSINQRKMNEICSTANALSIISGRWKATILQLLLIKKMRYTELSQVIPGISDRILVLQLRELEADGLVKRRVYAEVPPRVEYELTKAGHEMETSLKSLSEWGRKHRKKSMD